MKYCSHCGKELMDETVVCPACGCAVGANQIKNEVTQNKKYCSVCGKEVNVQAVICPNCGCKVGNINTQNKNGINTAIFVFMVIGCIANAFFYLIPLLWCIPMTYVFRDKVNKNEKVSTGFKVCTFLFVNFISGFLLLCRNEDDYN